MVTRRHKLMRRCLAASKVGSDRRMTSKDFYTCRSLFEWKDRNAGLTLSAMFDSDEQHLNGCPPCRTEKFCPVQRSQTHPKTRVQCCKRLRNHLQAFASICKRRYWMLLIMSEMKMGRFLGPNLMAPQKATEPPREGLQCCLRFSRMGQPSQLQGPEMRWSCRLVATRSGQ